MNFFRACRSWLSEAGFSLLFSVFLSGYSRSHGCSICDGNIGIQTDQLCVLVGESLSLHTLITHLE